MTKKLFFINFLVIFSYGCSEIYFILNVDSVLLTTEPIKLSKNWLILKPDKPLNIVGHAPHVMLEINQYKKLFSDLQKVQEDTHHYLGEFEAEIVSEKGDVIELNKDYIDVYYDKSVTVRIYPKIPIRESEEKLKFTHLKLRSNIEIKSASIYS